ncbi:exopolyphosphatase [Rodentibacter pneumotropicus]|uniref:Exopolyphosphatase n=1 Tax=Rodentibacter pneumotropicus TaxID=758 RepID=A0A3S4XZ42_9PAST|nr:exopolyphosphatase [Rodentibacter pneumotropicus]
MKLPGFDREQQRLLVLLVRLHIGILKMTDLVKFARYDERDVLSLIRLLRLAVILNKSRQATDKTQKSPSKLTALLRIGHWSLNKVILNTTH